ncbi:MAG: HemK/PrmC family methyltransferase, partial [Kiritimatiellia bacterium]|nr:HemK/PrmC family methyltransferase [Kiritimatiellia bacterium]
TNPRALSLARRNARLLHVGKRVRFFRTDLLTGLSAHSLDAVVSNPPYVRTTDWPELERQILRFEPRSAFDGGPDGLNPIRRLIRQARSALRQNGLFFLEIGEDQGPAARKILRREGFRNIVCHRDLQGHPRILAARRGADAAHC